MSMEQKDEKNRLPEFHWLTKAEAIARQKTERPRRGGSGHSDSTADEAIAKVYFWEMEKMKEEHDNDRSKKERTVRSDKAEEDAVETGTVMPDTSKTGTVRPDTAGTEKAGADADSASAETEKGKEAKI